MNFSAHFEFAFKEWAGDHVFGWAMKKGFHKMLIM